MGQMEKRRGGPLDLADPDTRAGILRTAALFLDLGFDGIHYDIEPLQRDDGALHALLDATHALTHTRGRLLSLATTEIEPFPGANALVNTPLPEAVLWSPSDYREAAARVDQLAVMSYNTALPWDWLYGSFMEFETRRIAAAVDGKAVIMMGVPTYEDRGWTFHPEAENMESALRGIRLALPDVAGAPPGIAIYAHWTTDDAEWATYQRLWRGEP
jgi:spore germination protein YaaH